jgi:hypothetical protein
VLPPQRWAWVLLVLGVALLAPVLVMTVHTIAGAGTGHTVSGPGPVHFAAGSSRSDSCHVVPAPGDTRVITVPRQHSRGLPTRGVLVDTWFPGPAEVTCERAVRVATGPVARAYALYHRDWLAIVPAILAVAVGWVLGPRRWWRSRRAPRPAAPARSGGGTRPRACGARP